MGYVPVFYDCILSAIDNIDGKEMFKFTNKKDNKQVDVIIDQPVSVIKKRMKEVIAGKRNKLYLTRGMRDIDVSYLGNKKWQLFDEFDVYEFDYEI